MKRKIPKSVHERRDPLDRNWTHDAACAGDPDTFDDPRNTPDIERAKAVCRRCTVADLCLRDAMRSETGGLDGRYGVWGGLTAQERAELAKTWRAA